MRTLLAASLLLALNASAVAAPVPEKKDEAQTAADLKAFKEYLAKNHDGKKWGTGPERLDSPEIRAAFGKRRFYHVFSSPPLPPGAPLPELLKEFEKRSADFRANFITVLVAIDEKGTILPLSKPEDLTAGLMKVTSDDEAKTAAAAILSLKGAERVAPKPVSAKDVTVTKADKGWRCEFRQKPFAAGTVTFDADGKCTAANRTDVIPLPPSTRPPVGPPPPAKP